MDVHILTKISLGSLILVSIFHNLISVQLSSPCAGDRKNSSGKDEICQNAITREIDTSLLIFSEFVDGFLVHILGNISSAGISQSLLNKNTSFTLKKRSIQNPYRLIGWWIEHFYEHVSLSSKVTANETNKTDLPMPTDAQWCISRKKLKLQRRTRDNTEHKVQSVWPAWSQSSHLWKSQLSALACHLNIISLKACSHQDIWE